MSDRAPHPASASAAETYLQDFHGSHPGWELCHVLARNA
ncbi:hypothetical protein BSIN_4369 [Burkholderia singularis]|uniref:Uncharacterized protein n=1 Tax=Burkholderia singularis TaxID=1503053 RepID=A0A238H8H3_9BURK|nr:hypothetical protein BSIN_4369 [Burkholderia singularis]